MSQRDEATSWQISVTRQGDTIAARPAVTDMSARPGTTSRSPSAPRVPLRGHSSACWALYFFGGVLGALCGVALALWAVSAGGDSRSFATDALAVPLMSISLAAIGYPIGLVVGLPYGVVVGLATAGVIAAATGGRPQQAVHLRRH